MEAKSGKRSFCTSKDRIQGSTKTYKSCYKQGKANIINLYFLSYLHLHFFLSLNKVEGTGMEKTHYLFLKHFLLFLVLKFVDNSKMEFILPLTLIYLLCRQVCTDLNAQIFIIKFAVSLQKYSFHIEIKTDKQAVQGDCTFNIEHPWTPSIPLGEYD